jgi:hypothetical protein
MNDNPLSDPGLQSLEARLASMPPRLAAGEQQQLLYQCAFVAGKAVGQEASRRVIQAWTAVASILALLCVGLAYRMTSQLEHTLAHSSPSDGAAEVERAQSAARLPSRDADDRRQLSVTTDLDRVVDFNWPRQSPLAQTADGHAAIDSEQPVLTSRSRISPDSI